MASYHGPKARVQRRFGEVLIPRTKYQQILEKRGYDVGRVDGVLGLKSRVAIRDAQIKFGLPADGWPTAELLARLRAAR